MAPPIDLCLHPQKAVLLIVDIQERLAAVMHEEDRKVCESNVGVLVAMATRMKIPVVASEQYPKGLGGTVPIVEGAITAHAASAGALRRFEKMTFACPEAPPFADIWRALYDEEGRDQWIVCGMETHICVYQTARALLLRGATVFCPRDAVASRTAENRAVGLGLIDRSGGVVTATEVLVFDALQKAGTDDFRALSRMIR